MPTDDYLQLACSVHPRYRAIARPRSSCSACDWLYTLNHTGEWGEVLVVGRACHREGDETTHGARYAMLHSKESIG